MHLFLTLGLLMVCGMIDAAFYHPRIRTFNQLMGRQQKSIPIPYKSYGYHYNPIEPSIDVLDRGRFSEGLDSTVNTFKPIYQNVKMSTHDVNSVPRTYSYQLKNSIYDSDYISVEEIPRLFPEEDSYDYKYLGSPLNKYLTWPSTQDSDIAINLEAMKKTSVFDYGFPTYKSPYSSDSLWNFGSKIPKTVFKDSLLVESDSDTFKISPPTVKIVKLFPETSEQESIITTTNNPKDTSLNSLFRGGLNEVIYSVKDELNYKTTQETSTEEESNFITTEETLVENKSNPVISEGTQTGDESNDLVSEENSTEEESSIITTEETLSEDKSNSIIFDFITTEDKLNYITTEENQKKDDESKSTSSQETATAFKLNTNTFLDESDIMSKINNILKDLKERNYKSQFKTVHNIPEKFQPNFSSDESTNQQFQPQLLDELDLYDEYKK